MELLTSTILTGLLWDTIKVGSQLSIDSLRNSLRDWVFDDSVLVRLQETIQVSGIHSDLNENAIKRKIDENESFNPIFKEIIRNFEKREVDQNNQFGHNFANTGSGTQNIEIK